MAWSAKNEPNIKDVIAESLIKMLREGPDVSFSKRDKKSHSNSGHRSDLYIFALSGCLFKLWDVFQAWSGKTKRIPLWTATILTGLPALDHLEIAHFLPCTHFSSQEPFAKVLLGSEFWANLVGCRLRAVNKTAWKASFIAFWSLTSTLRHGQFKHFAILVRD